MPTSAWYVRMKFELRAAQTRVPRPPMQITRCTMRVAPVT